MTVDHPGVFVEEVPSGARPIDGQPTSVTAFVGRFTDGLVNDPVHVQRAAEFAGATTGSARPTETEHTLRQFFANGGRDAVVVRASSPRVASLKQAVGALVPGDFNVLCIPEMRELEDADFADLVHFADGFCRKCNAFLLIDPNVPDDLHAILAFDPSIASENSAIYFPRVVVPDPSTEAGQRTIAVSGTVAGIFARTDARRGVWKAPAGLEATAHAITEMAGDPPSDRAIELITRRNINVLRKLSPTRTGVWGARTGDRSSGEWKYVPVRRLALFLEDSVSKGLQWAVFEPNGSSLWQAIQRDVVSFLGGLFRQGAFRGATPSDAFFVRCDRTTMTQADIDQGRVIVTIGFAPLRPAEFVTIEVELQTILQP